jgi:uncharacterized protein
LPDWYRRWAEQRGAVWVVLRIVVVVAAIVLIRNGLVTYIVIAVALVDTYLRGAVRTGRSLAEIGLDPKRAASGLGSGFALGAGVLTLAVAIFAIFGWYDPVEFAPGGGFSREFGAAVVFFALVAVVEELLFRGMVFRFLERKAGTWVAVALSAVAFGFLHITNPNATTWAATGLAIEAGVLFAAIYIATRSLWTCVGLHWAWNLFEGPVFGTPVSGQKFDVLIRADITGPELWTGGSFGPEGGLVVLLIGGLLGAALLVYAQRTGKLVSREASRSTPELQPESPPDSP